jgi:hypothetical protein
MSLFPQAPPGGFSNVSFGGEDTQADKFGSHNFNPKAQQQTQQPSATGPLTSAPPVQQKVAPVVERQQAPPVQQQQQQAAPKQDYRGRGGSSGGGSSSITFG